MHPAANRFFQIVKDQLPEFFDNKFVVDFGSYNVNGSTRPLFTNCFYTGVDLIEGPGVDIVGDCADIKFPMPFEVGVSSECFEHNPRWKESFFNLIENVQTDGLVLFSCAATGRPEHGTPRTNPDEAPGTNAKGWNYYKNLEFADFHDVLFASDYFCQCALFRNIVACDLYFIGFRRDFPDWQKQIDHIHAIYKALGPHHLISAFGNQEI